MKKGAGAIAYVAGSALGQIYIERGGALHEFHDLVSVIVLDQYADLDSV